MNNSLGDLNDIMFEQMRRLNNPELKGLELQEERGRAGSMVSVGKAIIDNAALVLEGEKFKEDRLDGNMVMPEMFEAKQIGVKDEE